MKFPSPAGWLVVTSALTSCFGVGHADSSSLRRSKTKKEGYDTVNGNAGDHGNRQLNIFEEECTASVYFVDTEEESVNEEVESVREVYLACETSSGLLYSVPVSEAWIVNHMANGLLKSSQTKLRMDGARFDQDTFEIVLDSLPQLVNKGHTEAADQGTRKLQSVDQRSVLMVRVIAANVDDYLFAGEHGENILSDSAFGTYGQEVSLKSQYSSCSQGRLEFRPATSREKIVGAGGPDSTAISRGVTTVNVDFAGLTSPYLVYSKVAQALTTQFGISSPRVLADHVMICYPGAVFAGVVAWAELGGGISEYNDSVCANLGVQMHEIGHNLNLHHSGEGAGPLDVADQQLLPALIQYGDSTGYMGSPAGAYDVRKCFNGAKLWQLGWLRDESLGYDHGLIVNDFDLPYATDLWSFTSNGSSQTPRAIKINRAKESALYLVFNWASAYNVGTREGRNTVTVVQQGVEGESMLLAKLSEGEVYVKSSYFEDGDGTSASVRIRVDDIDTNGGRARITISNQKPNWQYVGCYKDNPSRVMTPIGGGHSIDSCIAECSQRGEPYAGLQWYDHCFCGRVYNSLGKGSGCSTPCSRGGGECGGAWHNSVYIASQSYIGCYMDSATRALPEVVGAGYSIAGCISECANRNFPYAGLQYYNHCFCGNFYDTIGRAGSASGCDLDCTHGQGICGGSWRNSVYAVEPGGYLGCYRDYWNRAFTVSEFLRVMKDDVGPGYSIEECRIECGRRGKKYAGLQFHGQCFCDDVYDTRGEGTLCNAPCLNGGGICGGVWHNSVYTAIV